MSKLRKINSVQDVPLESCTKYAQKSKEPNDSTFIEYDPKDSFSANGTVRYGEEQDVDDL